MKASQAALARARVAQRRLRQLLAGDTNVNGIVITRQPTGRYGLVVRLVKERPLHGLPSAIDRVPVEYRLVGPATAAARVAMAKLRQQLKADNIFDVSVRGATAAQLRVVATLLRAQDGLPATIDDVPIEVRVVGPVAFAERPMQY